RRARASPASRSRARLRHRLRPRLADAFRLPVRLRGRAFVKASLVIPAYNEARRIEACVRAVAEWSRARPGNFDWEVLLVDDGSTGGTAALARRAGAQERLDLNVLGYARNRGKGAAIRVGVLASAGDPVLVSDTDLSTPLSEWAKLAGRLPSHPVVIGSRAIQ